MDTQLFWVHCDLSRLFRSEGRLDNAQIHVGHAKSHTTNSAYHLGCVAEEQDRLEEAKSEALRAADIYDKLEVAGEMKHYGELLQNIQTKLSTPASLGQPGFNRELL